MTRSLTRKFLTGKKCFLCQWEFFLCPPPQIFGNSSDRDVFYIFEATTHPICVQMVSKCDKMFILINRAKTISIVCLFPRNMFVFLVQKSFKDLFIFAVFALF